MVSLSRPGAVNHRTVKRAELAPSEVTLVEFGNELTVPRNGREQLHPAFFRGAYVVSAEYLLQARTPDEQLALKLVLVGDLLGSLFIRQVFGEVFQEGMSAGGDSADRLTCLRQIESSPIVKRTGYKGQLPQQLKRFVALLVNPKSEIAGSFQITPDAVVAVLVPGWIRCFRADGQFRNDEEARWILNDGKKPQGFPVLNRAMQPILARIEIEPSAFIQIPEVVIQPPVGEQVPGRLPVFRPLFSQLVNALIRS
jgi:hypothetical protein